MFSDIAWCAGKDRDVPEAVISWVIAKQSISTRSLPSVEPLNTTVLTVSF